MRVTPKPLPPLAQHCAVAYAFMSKARVVAPTRGLTRRKKPKPLHSIIMPMFDEGALITTLSIVGALPNEKHASITKALQGLCNKGAITRIEPGVFRRAVEGDYA